MTERLYDKDSHLKEFTAEVLSIRPDGGNYIAVLDRTAFFPEGGGQFGDRGTLNGANVLDTKESPDGRIFHILDRPLAAGEQVTGLLDWDCRFRRMQNHSGEHILSGVVHRLYGYDNVGFHLGESETTVDYNGMLSRSQLLKIEQEANKAVFENAKFSTTCPPPEELQTLSYRSKKELTGTVRIVTVEGYDACACCAPHVKYAGEIGVIKILDFMKNKDGVRLFIKCGLDALDDYESRYINTLKISSALSLKQFEVADGVDRLLNQIAVQKQTAARLKRELITEKIKTFSPDGDISALFCEGLDVKELQLFADGLYKAHGGIRGVFSEIAQGEYAFATCGSERELETFFAALKRNLNIRGGGRNGMVQGTVYAESDEITAAFLSK